MHHLTCLFGHKARNMSLWLCLRHVSSIYSSRLVIDRIYYSCIWDFCENENARKTMHITEAF